MDTPIPEIVADRLVIQDAAGTPRIVIGLDERGDPAVRLFDRNGDERAALALDSGQPGSADPSVTRAHLRLAASDNGTTIDLSAFESGYGMIEITNDAEENFAHLLLEVERPEGGRKAALLLGDRKGRMEFLVRDGAPEFGAQSG